MVEKNDRFEFLKAAYASLWNKHRSGELPYFLLIGIAVYNLAFFSLQSGKGFYTIFPLLLLIGVYFIKYWERDDGWIKYVGYTITIIAFLFDYFVSASYIPTISVVDGVRVITFRIASIPTLLFDIIGLFSAIYWWSNRKSNSENIQVKKD